MGYRSTSIAKSRDMGPLSALTCRRLGATLLLICEAARSELCPTVHYCNYGSCRGAVVACLDTWGSASFREGKNVCQYQFPPFSEGHAMGRTNEFAFFRCRNMHTGGVQHQAKKNRKMPSGRYRYENLFFQSLLFPTYKRRLKDRFLPPICQQRRSVRSRKAKK